MAFEHNYVKAKKRYAASIVTNGNVAQRLYTVSQKTSVTFSIVTSRRIVRF